MDLRPYQQAALDALFSWWNAGRQGEDPLIWLPTGSGKTVIFAHLIKRLMTDYRGVTFLILAHRKELISQAEDKLLQVWPEAPVGVYAASLDRREIAPITIASRDTIAPVIADIGQFTFAIIDECHRMNTKDEGRYQKIIHELRNQYADLVVIGFTATPFRLGQGRIYGEGKPFAGIAYKKPMMDMIKEGWLAPLTSIHTSRGEIDTTGIKMRGGDFDEHELSERASEADLVQAAIDEWLETAYQAGRKHSVFFCVSVLHAGIVSEKLHRAGIDAPVITGTTPDHERDITLLEFNQGKYAAIVNVGVLTEGWDAPLVDCIVLMRPTQSSSLYCQMVGRGLRLSPATGKTNCAVLDFGGNIKRLGPVDQADECEPKAKKRKKCPACGFSNEPEAIDCLKCGAHLKQDAPYKRCGEWNEETHVFENGCGHKNATAAVECAECGKPFIKHEAKAQRGGITSQEKVIEWFPVESISHRVSISQSSGQHYLRIAYHCGLFETFYHNLMVGYSGYAGQKAINEIVRMTIIHGDKTELLKGPQQISDGLHDGSIEFRKVAKIAINMADRWKPVIQTIYADQEITA